MAAIGRRKELKEGHEKQTNANFKERGVGGYRAWGEERGPLEH